MFHDDYHLFLDLQEVTYFYPNENHLCNREVFAKDADNGTIASTSPHCLLPVIVGGQILAIGADFEQESSK